jgi:DNA-directed RNA polymerase specialized sigma24 family protein
MTDNEKLIILMSNPKRYQRVVDFLARYYRNRDAVMDAVSDVMLELMDGTLRYEYQDTAKPESFIIAHARYRLARPLKIASLDDPVGDGKSVLADLIPGGCNTADAMDRLDATLEVKKISQRIRETSLGKKYQVFKLMKLGLSPREMVDFLNIGMEEVMNHIASIRQQAKECLI